jgi:hypothetical protein
MLLCISLDILYRSAHDFYIQVEVEVHMSLKYDLSYFTYTFALISSNLCVLTGSGSHPGSYPMCTGRPHPGFKTRPGCDADLSIPSSAEVKND